MTEKTERIDVADGEVNAHASDLKHGYIEFAPWNIPFQRRLQTLVVLLWISGIPVSLYLFLMSASVPILWPLVIIYFIFMFFDRAPDYGGRAIQWCKNSIVWKYYADYFPMESIKASLEADLDPSRNYIFGYHPHGIISMGAWCNFATNGTSFAEKFPGIQPHLLTLSSNFNIPFYRDYLLIHGLGSVAKKSCINILKSGPGQSIVIVVGGAQEALYAKPGRNDLTLRKRHGFIKLAISNNASLVPVFSFGENDLYEQVQNDRGGKLWQFQEAVKKVAGWTMPLIYGRGVFNYNFGLLPHRRPIHTIFGQPIHPPKRATDGPPTEEEVLQIQSEYIAELENIYNRYKDVYAKDRKKDLEIVE